jgi:transketolase
MTATSRAVQAKAIELGKLAIKATTSAGSGHPTTALSLAHLTAVLMYRVMRRLPPDRCAAPASPRSLGGVAGHLALCGDTRLPRNR